MTGSEIRSWLAFGWLVIAALALPVWALAQPPVTLRPGTTLFQLDLARTPVGELPAPPDFELVSGILEVVLKNGIPMLKASAASEFRITLPQGQVLPRDFTLEFDLIPKRGSNPQDLSFEGTARIDQGSGSAHVLWHATGSLAVIGGGGESYETEMPEDLKTTLPGVLTRVAVEVEGPTLKLYTNGRRLYTLQKQFARGGVLRVYLGAQNGGTEAVYLAGLRISAGSGLGIVAASAGLPPGRPPPPLPPGIPPAPAPQPGPTTPPPPPQPGPAPSAGRVGPGPTGPGRPTVTPVSPATKAATQCTPAATQGAPPLNLQAGGGRVGGAVLEWWTVPAAEYLVERSPDPGTAGRNWTKLTSTCDVPDGMLHFMRLWEDGNSYPAITLTDIYPGLQLGTPYVYRVTVIHADGTSGSSEVSYTPVGGLFLASPLAAVNGNTVRLAADVSYCLGFTPPIRCDPWMIDIAVTNSSSGYAYSSRQPFGNSYDPQLPPTIPGGIDGTSVYTISGVPSGTHTFTLTAVYQPDHYVKAGSVTVVIP